MGLENFFDANYQVACTMQRGINKDNKMKEMLSFSEKDSALVHSWMKDYGLFQGITSEDRKAIVDRYLSTIHVITEQHDTIDNKCIERMFTMMMTEFYNVVPRKWLSATSKLLWCSFPDNVVIYDAFVERAIMILQGITPYLADFPRIQTSPAVRNMNDIAKCAKFYINYQDMVKAILNEHQHQLDKLRIETSETYPHDIRIVDKLLWMLGNPNQAFTLNNVICRPA